MVFRIITGKNQLKSKEKKINQETAVVPTNHYLFPDKRGG